MTTVRARFGPDGPQPDKCGCVVDVNTGDPRWMIHGALCGVCGFTRRPTDHCHLLETCDRCHDEQDPCGTALALR